MTHGSIGQIERSLAWVASGGFAADWGRLTDHKRVNQIARGDIFR